MEAFTNFVSWRHIATTVAVYFATLVIYRLFLHPLARFPGPRLAAISRWYEAYYDVVKNGQYTFKIAELHKKYGPIIRISPYELHVNDSAFYNTLYCQDGRWNKYDWAVDAFAAKGAPLFTVDHNVHRARRQPLNPFFSKMKVASRQDQIRKHLYKLRVRLSKFAVSRQTINLGAALTAFTRDVANEFILGKAYNCLDRDDFDIAQLTASQGAGHIWRLSKHIRWVAPALRAIPVDWIMKYGDNDTKLFFSHLQAILQETMQDTERIMTAASSSSPDDKDPRTMVHEILESSLPASEKSFVRVFEDVSTTTGAGFETTASALRLIFFHLFSNAHILQRLRAELASTNARFANVSEAEDLDLKTLEQLPYLTLVLMEGLRLSPAIATRMARVAPDRDLFYREWRIPAGTPVGMTTILMHTDETVYPEPRRFNPDRWMDSDAQRKVDKAFAPFSRGTRICLGMHLAWAEMYMIVAALAQHFDFQFEGATAEDFECTSDQFAVGTKGKGMLIATVTSRRD
ncbi:hypothetical protein DL764_008276 [Monosporascus ibericus]|uniref:Trichodiene oxygenase n=1 Tax=Monosporascus ibericus TaxID=155417 RepID=A0A4Q4SXX5_9PEZI|nr:hypothetical protein DL764_008276 [Monosporascus ibericus]